MSVCLYIHVYVYNVYICIHIHRHHSLTHIFSPPPTTTTHNKGSLTGFMVIPSQTPPVYRAIQNVIFLRCVLSLSCPVRTRHGITHLTYKPPPTTNTNTNTQKTNRYAYAAVVLAQFSGTGRPDTAQVSQSVVHSIRWKQQPHHRIGWKWVVVDLFFDARSLSHITITTTNAMPGEVLIDFIPTNQPTNNLPHPPTNPPQKQQKHRSTPAWASTATFTTLLASAGASPSSAASQPFSP